MERVRVRACTGSRVHRRDGMSWGVQVSELATLLSAAAVLPELSIDDPERAVPLAELLLAEGLTVIEVSLRSPNALEAIQAIRKALPALQVGAGTVMSGQDIDAARQAGAQFAVTPGFDEAVLRFAIHLEVPLIPGIMTPGEALRARSMGFEALKLFPASAAGGIEWLRAVAGPMPELLFCPTGGIDADNAGAFLALPNVACVGASWLAPPQLLRGENWAEIRCRIQHAARLRAA